jgi:hypothetical protein
LGLDSSLGVAVDELDELGCADCADCTARSTVWRASVTAAAAMVDGWYLRMVYSCSMLSQKK